MGCPGGGVLCRAQGMSMNLPFLQLQPPQINKGKEAMSLKTSLLRVFFFLSIETSVEIAESGPNPAVQESAAVTHWAAGFANPQQRSYFLSFSECHSYKAEPHTNSFVLFFSVYGILRVGKAPGI